MRRMFVSVRVAFFLAICATSVLIASNVSAVAQLLDPGWQIVYAGQPNYGGGGVISSIFGDGAVMTAVPRAYQSAPMYYQTVSAPRGYQAAPVYYQQAPAAVPQAYQPAPVYYYRPVPAPLPRAYQAVPAAYDRRIPSQRVRAVAPSPNYNRQVAAQQTLADQGAPRYTSAIPLRQTATAAPKLQPAPAPRPRGLFQLAWGPQQTAPTQPEPLPAPPPRPSFFQFPWGPQQPTVAYGERAPAYAPSEYGDMAHPMVDPKFDRQLVDYHGDEKPGTIIIDTPHFFLYLVLDGSKAIRYGIGVGRPGFTWSGVKEITAMREWPDWRPPTDMLERRPDLPRYMAGGVDNPLGARALYLGSTLYRIHGSNEPWTIGTQVSSGCIRLRNADIIDLYQRVKVGTKVVVI